MISSLGKQGGRRYGQMGSTASGIVSSMFGAGSTETETVTGGISSGNERDSRDIRKRVWIEGEPYDIPIDALADVARWMPKKALKKAAKEKRVPRIEVIGRTNDGVEARQEVRQEEWPVMAEFLAQATFVTPGILEFAAFEEARRLLRRRKILTLLLMAA